jgi:hypothetical protein
MYVYVVYIVYGVWQYVRELLNIVVPSSLDIASVSLLVSSGNPRGSFVDNLRRRRREAYRPRKGLGTFQVPDAAEENIVVAGAASNLLARAAVAAGAVVVVVAVVVKDTQCSDPVAAAGSADSLPSGMPGAAVRVLRQETPRPRLVREEGQQVGHRGIHLDVDLTYNTNVSL